MHQGIVVVVHSPPFLYIFYVSPTSLPVAKDKLLQLDTSYTEHSGVMHGMFVHALLAVLAQCNADFSITCDADGHGAAMHGAAMRAALD